MKTFFQFATQHLNVNGLWRTTVLWRGETIPAERLWEHVMNECGFDRRTMDRLKKTILGFLTEELVAGNSVNLFDVVRLRMSPQVKFPCVRTESEADAQRETARLRDVDWQVASHVPCTYSRQMGRRMWLRYGD